MLPEISLLLLLILLNGVFAMSEIAVVSSKRARLVQLAADGNRGAAQAVELIKEPTRFLSTVQVGITCIGILTGAVGGTTIAIRLRVALEDIPFLAGHAEAAALIVMVGGLAYVSLVVGELVPKRLAMTSPEIIASAIALPMRMLSTVGRPVVHVLSVSTDTILRLFGVQNLQEPAVTLEEIKLLIERGAREGVVERTEHELVTNVLNLDERHVSASLTPRSEVVFLDAREPLERNTEKLRASPHSVFPLCDGGCEHVIGFVRSTRVLERLLQGTALDLRALAEPPLFVPGTMTLMSLLEHFKRTHLPAALVVDEFGEVNGLVTLTDVLSAIVGDLPGEQDEEPPVVRRDDGSWLMDGAIDIDTVSRHLGAEAILNEEDRRQHVHTLGGLAMLALDRIPRTGDHFVRGSFRFEVVDMDGNRVDRMLVSQQGGGDASASAKRTDAETTQKRV